MDEKFWEAKHDDWLISVTSAARINALSRNKSKYDKKQRYRTSKYFFPKSSEAYRKLKHLFGLGLYQYQTYHACEID